jgi:hypothetical protein
VRTGGLVAAPRADQGRDRPLVDADGEDEEFF